MVFVLKDTLKNLRMSKTFENITFIKVRLPLYEVDCCFQIKSLYKILGIAHSLAPIRPLGTLPFFIICRIDIKAVQQFLTPFLIIMYWCFCSGILNIVLFHRYVPIIPHVYYNVNS